MEGSSPYPRQRVAIIGAGGRLGGALAKAWQREHDLIRLDRGAMDLADPRVIREVLEPLEFDVLVLTAAMTAVDGCESDEPQAFAVNAEAPATIAEICTGKGARMVHFSTDFVFDGAKRGPYTEADAPAPVSLYGASKLAGEERVLAAGAAHLVVRVSWVYGAERPAFPEWIVAKAIESRELSLPADKIGSPTRAEDVALLLPPLIFDPERPAAGVVHLANSGACTWQEWGQHCLDVARGAGVELAGTEIAAAELASVAAFVAKRPPNSALDTGLYQRLTGIAPRPWRDACTEHLKTSTLPRSMAAV